MTWEISHTEDAWAAFERGLYAQDEKWLAEAVATSFADRVEQKVKEIEDSLWSDDMAHLIEVSTDWQKCYQDALEDLSPKEGMMFATTKDELVEMAMDECRHWNSCSNGGFAFYIDREGYYEITLADYAEEEEDDG